MQWRQYIRVDARVLCGKPVIAGTRLSVGLILECLAAGMTRVDIMREYPTVREHHIDACLACGAALAYNARVLPRHENGSRWIA